MPLLRGRSRAAGRGPGGRLSGALNDETWRYTAHPVSTAAELAELDEADQGDVDRLFSAARGSASRQSVSVPRGIGPETLALMRETLAAAGVDTSRGCSLIDSRHGSGGALAAVESRLDESGVAYEIDERVGGSTHQRSSSASSTGCEPA